MKKNKVYFVGGAEEKAQVYLLEEKEEHVSHMDVEYFALKEKDEEAEEEAMLDTDEKLI
jgi:NAD(P)H-flavin reductase